jgi:hypothetical protein
MTLCKGRGKIGFAGDAAGPELSGRNSLIGLIHN